MTIDWNDAFDNSSYVADSDKLAEKWSKQAQQFRQKQQQTNQAKLNQPYATKPRNQLDLFNCPEQTQHPQGTILFIHGGYWHQLDKTYWSHLAQGALANHWHFAIPSYTLAPQASISQITQEIAQAIDYITQQNQGKIRLIGHSAGGHLVSRMVCDDSPLSSNSLSRLEKVISVSGIHDLTPLLKTDMNYTLKLSPEDAMSESPARHKPHPNHIPTTFWVGTQERPELIRQTRLACEAWENQHPKVNDYYQANKNHFSIIEALAQPDSELVKAITQ